MYDVLSNRIKMLQKLLEALNHLPNYEIIYLLLFI